MKFKKIFVFICLIICLFIMAACASDVNQTDFNSSSKVSYSDCCSFVIQEENETVFAFRQDAEPDEYGVAIHNDRLDNLETIVQEVDAPDTHFIHAMVTEAGWVTGHGGDSSNVRDTRALESVAFEMLVSKNISSDSLKKIQKILKKYNYGHFFIKAPDGSYGVVYSDKYLVGTLKPGEFLVIPNEYSGFRGGNYTAFDKNPVDAIVKISSHEDSGTNRRNLYSYDYKVHNATSGQRYGVDVYVTNDNGHDVGLNTSDIVNYCYFNDEFYPPSVIPENPDKLSIGTYIFENQSADLSLDVLSLLNRTLINNNTLYNGS